jgi:predicted MPP superfamily phosphohydrolase
MRRFTGFGIVALIMIVIDIYVFQAVKFLMQGNSDKARLTVFSIYWTVSILSLAVVISFPFISAFQTNKFLRNYVFAVIVGLFFAKLLAMIFFLLDDIRRGFLWIMGKLFSNTGARFLGEEGTTISRSAFLSWLGVGIGGTFLGSFIWGFSNKYDYHLRKVKLSFSNLPQSFKGLKIVQISDIHSGSFQDKHAVERGVELALKQNPDIILFTGDLVNDIADEMNDYIDVFSKLNAPLGVYSVLGNHDYGDYYQWKDRDEHHAEKEKQLGKRIHSPLQEASINKVKEIQAQMGWRLLMNEHVAIERNGEQIGLLGIENWGAKGFARYGKMHEAHAGTEVYPFKILLSHDPSHWDAEVRLKYSDVDLTLAGHTHGMQFGIENPYFKWSPVQWIYKQWAGLYEEGKQKLYVNRGYGFIGYPGRVGILPEVTLIELV